MLNLGVPVSDSLKGMLFSKPKNIFDGIETAYPLNDTQTQAIEACLKVFDSGFHGFGYLLSMGLRKTNTTLTTARILRAQGKIKALVVICPKTLLDSNTWIDEIAKHVIEPVKSITWDSTKAKSDKWQKEFDGLLTTQDMSVFIVNIEAFQVKNETLQKCFKKLEKIPTLMAIDESSKIASPTAACSKAICKYGEKASYRLILTGTEIRNSPLDVYMQGEFLQKGFWGKNYYQFKMRYAVIQTMYLSGGRKIPQVVGYQNLDELQEKFDKVVFRAHKDNSVIKNYETLTVDLSGEQNKIYADFKTKLLAIINDELVPLKNKISAFQKLRQVVGGTVKVDNEAYRLQDNPKLDILLDDVKNTDEQAIIFCAFSEEIQLVSEALIKEGYTAVMFDGHKSNKLARKTAKLDYESGKARFFVTNPKCASHGLNLQFSHIVYWYTLPLSMNDILQGESRIDRDGQKEPCIFKRIIARDTVDERVLSLFEQKKDVLDGFRHGTLADILNLVK